MNSNEFGALLEKLNACQEAREWAEGKTLQEVWSTCNRADWMLWLCVKMATKKGWPTRKEVVLATCDCAETAFKFLPVEEKRPIKALAVVRAWARGNATREEFQAARLAAAEAYAFADADAGYAAYATYAVFAAAAYAADAYAADAADAAYAAAYATYAAATSAYAADAARAKALAEMADIVRATLVIPLLVEGEK